MLNKVQPDCAESLKRLTFATVVANRLKPFVSFFRKDHAKSVLKSPALKYRNNNFLFFRLMTPGITKKDGTQLKSASE